MTRKFTIVEMEMELKTKDVFENLFLMSDDNTFGLENQRNFDF